MHIYSIIITKQYSFVGDDMKEVALAGTSNEGWFDPWSLLSAFKKKALAMGVHYVSGQVEGVGMDGNKVASVKVRYLLQ